MSKDHISVAWKLKENQISKDHIRLRITLLFTASKETVLPFSTQKTFLRSADCMFLGDFAESRIASHILVMLRCPSLYRHGITLPPIHGFS